MRHIFLFILVSFALLAKAETYVVCVGIGNYANPKMTLYQTEKDAKDMADFYKHGTDNVITITGKDATKTNVLNCLKSQFSRAKSGDKIVFFFSGHGYAGGFCPYEMSTTADGLTYSEVVDIMRSSKATDKLIFADACNSGAIRNDKKTDLPDFGHIVCFLASRGREAATESITANNGYFTRNLIRGLSGAADTDNDRIITAKELFIYVSNNVKEQTHDKQHPVMWGNFPDDFVVVKYRKR
ncbi:MAG: caspase family protein [Muribaculaceae bacterium]|nr:caspase family protein [Muribaculaceae bacterium]